MRLTTAITAATPMTTPISVRTLRSLCAQRLEAEMATASDKFIVVGRGIEPGDTNAPHPNIRAGLRRDIMAKRGNKVRCGRLKVEKKNRAAGMSIKARGLLDF